jgi:hypothetical protein
VVCPLVANVAEIEFEFVIGVSIGAYVDQVVVEELGHAIDGPFDGDVAIKEG